MLWCLVLLAAASAQAAVWPDQIGGFRKQETAIPVIEQRELLDEFGFRAAERAVYESGTQRFTGSAYRFNDSTGAFAYFNSQRPTGARPSRLAELALETSEQLLLARANYFLRFEGRKPRRAELSELLGSLERLDHSPLPTLRAYLPEAMLVANSQRFVLGPVSLAQAEPRIPANIAAFEFSTEAYVGKYRTPSGDATLAIFAYPNGHIARSRIREFERIPGAAVKRSGPLLAVVLPAAGQATSAAAEKLLGLVNYQAEVTVSELPPLRSHASSAAEMLLSIFALAGLLLLLCIAGGILIGVFRIGGRRWFGKQRAEDPMIMLHLADRENAMRSEG